LVVARTVGSPVELSIAVRIRIRYYPNRVVPCQSLVERDCGPIHVDGLAFTPSFNSEDTIVLEDDEKRINVPR
jgi:hypothetical protein